MEYPAPMRLPAPFRLPPTGEATISQGQLLHVAEKFDHAFIIGHVL